MADKWRQAAPRVTLPRFLIDENLSPTLVEPARALGFEAMHVNHLGLRTETDWDLLTVVAEQDWVLVTNNAVEFRGRFREHGLHPGVVFILPAVRRADQLLLFKAALAACACDPDLVNRALDVSFGPDRTVAVVVYNLP